MEKIENNIVEKIIEKCTKVSEKLEQGVRVIYLTEHELKSDGIAILSDN